MQSASGFDRLEDGDYVASSRTHGLQTVDEFFDARSVIEVNSFGGTFMRFDILIGDYDGLAVFRKRLGLRNRELGCDFHRKCAVQDRDGRKFDVASHDDGASALVDYYFCWWMKTDREILNL